MSVIHPGSSINFDGTALQRSEEEEIRREDIKQQQELHELLSAELPEDLLEDSCDGSLTSAKRDASGASYNDFQGSSNAGSWQQSSLDSGDHHETNRLPSEPLYYNNQVAPIRYTPNGYEQEHYANNHEHSYTDAEKWQMQQQQRQLHQPVMRNNGVGDYEYHSGKLPHTTSNPDIYGFSERREAEGSEDFDAVQHSDSLHYDNKLSNTLPSYSPMSRTSTSGKNVRFDTFSAPTSPYNQYSAQYKHVNRFPYGSSEEATHQSNINQTNKGEDSIGSDYVDASDGNTPDINDSLELKQLRILYEARGKTIDKLKREIDGLQQDANREKRILSHQLAMAKDQKNGMSGSLEECQQMLYEKDRRINEEEGKAKALEIEVESLKLAKAELVKKVEVGERAIENLQQELAMLQRSDALERARQQHEAVISASNERHEEQLLEVTSMLDEVRRVADAKTEESEQLRSRLKAALRESEDVLLEKTDTINRLSRNLEDAQNHCQTLLAGSGEYAFLQRQVNDLLKLKTDLEENNKNLEKTLEDAHKNLAMYDSAFQLGVTSRPPASSAMTDSYSELMGIKKKIDWKTPTSSGAFKNQPESLVNNLRSELERAITNNKEKRDQVTQLQKHINELTEESRHWRERVDELEQQVKSSPSSRIRSSASPREEMESLEKEFEESLERAHDAEERAMRLEETCRDLKQQMCEMVEEHDANKQEAVDRCERACMQLHEDAKQAIREELTAEHEQKIYELSIEHEGQHQDLKNALDEVRNELSEVKQSYVHVCSDKDNLEEKLNSLHESEKLEILSKYEEEKNAIRASIEKEWEEKRKQEEKEWEERNETNIKTRIALAKVAWMEEHSQAREDSIREVSKAKEQEFNQRIESLRNDLRKEADENTAKLLEEKKGIWEAEKEKEFQSRLNAVYEELNEDKKTAVSAATSIAQLNWITEQQHSAETEYERRIEEAKRTWEEEHESVTAEKVKEAVSELQSRIKVLTEEKDSAINEELQKAEREWKRKREESLRRKDEEMQEQLNLLQDQHQKDYEKFTNEHKRSLEKFLEHERSRSSSQDQKDTLDEMNKQWSAERDHLQQAHQSELKRLQNMYETRCNEYRSEIQRLSSAYDNASRMKLSGEDKENLNDKIEEIQRKNKADADRLKSRMKEEYRRWKREREDLKAKLEEAKKIVVVSPQSEAVDLSILSDLREVYVGTLGSIKDEILQFVRDSRARSLNAIKSEAERERLRIVEKLKARPRGSSSSYVPSFLADDQSVYSSDRFSKVLQSHSSTSQSMQNRVFSAPPNDRLVLKDFNNDRHKLHRTKTPQ